jgi:hypothetical protein
VASISKTVVLQLYEQQACSAVRRYQNSFHTHTAFVRNIPYTELVRVFKKIRHVHASVQTRGWPFLTSVVTRVHIRNIFYYKHTQYARSPQQVQLLFKAVWAADRQFHIELVVFGLNF